MRLGLLFTVVIVILSSCSLSKRSSVIRPEDGLKFYEQKSPDLTIRLLGDYRFHALNTKYFRDIDKSCIKYFKQSLKSYHPQLMFAAHTAVPIYYSSLCIQYKGIQADSSLLMSVVKKELRKNLKASFNECKKLETDFGTVYCITYLDRNPVTDIYTTHMEYFINHGDYLIRMFFWTSDSAFTEIKREVETIVKTVILH